MVKQVTISPSFQKKMTKLQDLVGDNIAEQLQSLGNYAVQISPVQTGAFVESWSIRPIGSGGGRSRSSNNKPLKDFEAAKEDARSNIASDVSQFKDRIIADGGAVIANRSPHAEIVDEKYMTIRRVKDKFR